MTLSRSCPKCDHEILFHMNAPTTQCQNCGASFKVENDADFVDGSWRDLTSLVLIKETESKL